MKYENKMLTYENSLGLLIAVLILFDFRFEKNIIDLINTPLGITSVSYTHLTLPTKA